MLIPLIFQAKDQSSGVIKGIASSFNSLNSSALEASSKSVNHTSNDRYLSLGNGAIQINAVPGMDVNTMADVLMERLDREFNRSVNNLLA